jgi:sugar lactone lactonase YvrE
MGPPSPAGEGGVAEGTGRLKQTDRSFDGLCRRSYRRFDRGRFVKISRVRTAHCLVGEGPVWDVTEQSLYFLDIAGRIVHRYDPKTGTTRSWQTPQPVGAMTLRESGGAVLALKGGVYALDLDSGGLTLLTRLEGQDPRAQFNDGKVDRRGRFLVGLSETDMHAPRPVGAICRLDADHRLTMLEAGFLTSNSPCFSPDDKTFYFSDSLRYTTFAYDYDIETGQISGKRLFADTRALGGMPDGATVDCDGLVWMAIFQGGKIVAFRPDGKVERTIEMPVKLAVSVMFGGPDLDQLFVTTIDPAFFGGPREEGAGNVYLIEGLGVRGLPEPRYAG